MLINRLHRGNMVVWANGRLTKHALGTYLDPVDGNGEVDVKGEQLFYKLANLDDRIKNADQVCYIFTELSGTSERSVC